MESDRTPSAAWAHQPVPGRYHGGTAAWSLLAGALLLALGLMDMPADPPDPEGRAREDRFFEVVHDDGETLRVVTWEDYEQVQARFGVLLSFARPVDIQAAERHIEKYGLLDSDGNRLPDAKGVDLG